MTKELAGYEIKEAYSAKWLRIFHHESQGGVYFDNFSEASFSLNPKKYSVLKLIPKIRTYSRHNYEFLLEYPQCSPYFNRWKQSSKITSSAIADYEPIEIAFSSGFAGLRKYPYKEQTAYFGLSADRGWHFAIGAYTYYSETETFPGPLNNCSKYYVNEANLWIRISSFEDIFRFNICTGRIFKPVSNKIILLITHTIYIDCFL